MTIEETRRLSLVRDLLEMTLPLENIIRELSVITWDYDGEGVELMQGHLTSVLQRYLHGEVCEADIELWANQVEGRDDIQLDARSEPIVEEILHELANPLLTQPLNHIRAQQLLSRLVRSEWSDRDIADDFSRFTAEDLSVENDVLLLGELNLACRLSGIAFVDTSGIILVAQEKALGLVRELVNQHLPDFEAWLLVGHTAWQPDTQIVRYKKIWSYLRGRNPDIPDGLTLEEFPVESEQGIKYFSAVRCEEFDPKQALGLLREEMACTLVFANNSEALGVVIPLLKRGWSKQGVIPSPELLDFACSSNVVVGSLIGAFDDREAGFALIGRFDLMEGMLRTVSQG